MDHIISYLTALRFELHQYLISIALFVAIIGILYRSLLARRRSSNLDIKTSVKTVGDNSPVMIGSNHKMDINNAHHNKNREPSRN